MVVSLVQIKETIQKSSIIQRIHNYEKVSAAHHFCTIAVRIMLENVTTFRSLSVYRGDQNIRINTILVGQNVVTCNHHHHLYLSSFLTFFLGISKIKHVRLQPNHNNTNWYSSKLLEVQINRKYQPIPFLIKFGTPK